MKTTILAVGRLRPGPFRTLAEFYEKRLRAHGGVQLHEIPHGAASLSPKERMIVEGKKLLAHVADGDWLVALDREGRQLDSLRWARRLGSWQQEGRNPVLLIGGADGLAPAVLDRARERFSFSAMTFPHELFRIMLYEQIYRGHCILAGHPYHK